jgi:PAS domain-containing protein
MIFQKKIKYLLIFTLILVPLISFGQFAASGLELIVTISPSTPKPNQSVSISIENYSFDLSQSNITWFVNGIVQNQFSRKKSLNLKTGDVGSPLIVDVSVITPSGTITEKRIVIQPSELNLLWEASGYTPPFYRGKVLHSSKGTIKTVAMADVIGSGGFRLSNNSLDYKWSRDGKILESLSGVGKNTFTIKPFIINPGFTTISLKITEKGRGTVLATKSIRVIESSPKIIFYEDHPLLGISFNRAFQKTFFLDKEELKIKSSLYFFSKEDKDSLNYQWRINGKKVAGNEDSLLVRITEEKGVSSISLEVKNLLKTLQFASAGFFIEFGNNI